MAKILVVDDDPDFVDATTLVLEKHGHEVVNAASGDSGFEKVMVDSPDLVVLDVIMDSVLDGLSLSQRLSEEPALRNIPIIMVTSIANTDYAELFPMDEYIHIDAFMSKPIAAADLIRQVDRLLKT